MEWPLVCTMEPVAANGQGEIKYEKVCKRTRTPKYYDSHEESYADFKRIWSTYYGRFPDKALATKWTGNDHPDQWLHNVRTAYAAQ